MDTDHYKKYTILENILQKLNQKYVQLSPEEIKRNNKLLQVIDKIIQKLRSKSVLFDNMYQNKFYGGSFYDGLKVGSPSEYDLDCVLCLPKLVKPTVEVSDRPGYVHLVLKDFKALGGQADELPKYPGLDQLLDDNNYLSTKKVRGWMEGLMTSVVNGTVTTEISIDDANKCRVKYKVVKSGPALTIKMEVTHNDQIFPLDVDLVPCFTFFDDQWPKKGYKKNPSSKNTFFLVPKSPSDDYPLHWRLSFQEQERELLARYLVLKPTIRLIKKIRDRYQHKAIASYFIKTIFLWELETIDKTLWNKSLSFVFVMMLKRYSEYIEKKNIPYYWNKSNNLIADVSDVTASGIANTLRNIVDHIDKICNSKSDLYGVLKFFLSNEEFDVDVFKQEVPLSKKLLKLMAPQSQEPVVCESTSGISSRSSSFEEITKDMLPEVPPQQKKDNQKLETLVLALVSEQRRMYGMLETAIVKIEHCEEQIKELKCELDKKQIDDTIQRKELMDMLQKIDKKIDAVNKGDSSSVDDLLGLTGRFDIASLSPP